MIFKGIGSSGSERSRRALGWRGWACLLGWALSGTNVWADAADPLPTASSSPPDTLTLPVADAQDPDYPARRKSQFPSGFGYAVFPYPYSLPGLGSGLSVVAGAANVADTPTDTYGIVFGGDVKGAALGVSDIHLLPRRLILDLGYARLSRASIETYSTRGMESRKDDFRLLEVGDTAFYGGRLTGTFVDRRFEVYGAWYGGASRLKSIRDADGELILAAQNAPREHVETHIFGGRIDLTDDYADPRRGMRLEVSRTQSPSAGSDASYYVMDYSAAGYVPVGKRNTWAFNLFRSDAVVKRRGETDPVKLQNETGLQCDQLTDPTLLGYCQQVIDNMAAENRFGTATQLGGFSRLRGYPQGRFKGAHTLFMGTEFRWNLNEEETPFDLFVMKDVRTLMQVAFFYETGVSSDTASDLWKRKNMRDTVGAGFRIVTASGVVLRADMGFSRDGPGAAVFIGYPWEL